MKEGSKPIIFHTIHTAIVFYCMVVAIILGPCFGLDDVDKYTCFFRHGEYTILSYFYDIPLMFFLILLVFFGSFHSVPYVITYWVKYRRKFTKDNAKKGKKLTLFALFLIMMHPFGMFYFSDMIDGYIEFWNDVSGVIIYITIIIPVYYLPYAFIRLSCPQVALLPKYRIYKTVLTSQLIVYLILLIYVNSPFPAVLSEYIDQNYLHWIHR